MKTILLVLFAISHSNPATAADVCSDRIISRSFETPATWYDQPKKDFFPYSTAKTFYSIKARAQKILKDLGIENAKTLYSCTSKDGADVCLQAKAKDWRVYTFWIREFKTEIDGNEVTLKARKNHHRDPNFAGLELFGKSWKETMKIVFNKKAMTYKMSFYDGDADLFERTTRAKGTCAQVAYSEVKKSVEDAIANDVIKALVGWQAETGSTRDSFELIDSGGSPQFVISPQGEKFKITRVNEKSRVLTLKNTKTSQTIQLAVEKMDGFEAAAK